MTNRAKRAFAAVAMIALIGTTSACAGTDAGADDGRPTVLAAFYPLAFVAEQVGGPNVRVTNLTTPGVEPHDLELTPRQVGAIYDADLVLYLKGFQPALDEAIEQAGGRSLEISMVVPLAEASGEPDGHEDGATGTPDEHGHGADRDPHFWLDPSRLAIAADAVAGQLSAVAPDQSGAFAQRADQLKNRLTALDDEFRAGLTGCQRTEFVTAHDAFGYLARRFGLVQVPIAGIEPDQEPSAARLQEIQQLVRDHHTTTIFFETLLSADLAETIARDTGATTAVLDPVEGIKDTAASDYFSVMRANLAALRKALSCP
ncbi:MAG: metal ABC transporter substrate-binding protein [Sporichthyaceae bacterium]|nr:metal ABC transporter substrate-binding protein [Sporichthyaceae bacterium]